MQLIIIAVIIIIAAIVALRILVNKNKCKDLLFDKVKKMKIKEEIKRAREK